MRAAITDRPSNRPLNAAAGLDGNQQHHSPVDEEQIMNLTDMSDLSQEMQDIGPLPKELLLVSLVYLEQALYNPKHENYRNTQQKDIKWMSIAENVGWSETQCKAKWKAMRDQYCRELKKSKMNPNVNVKWKYFKELDFLRPYALSRNYRARDVFPENNNNTNIISNNNVGNNNNSFNCSPTISTSSELNSHLQSENKLTEFTTIKMENKPSENFPGCDFSNIKTGGHLSSVLEQQTADDNNWTFTNNNNSRLNSQPLGDETHLLSTNHHQNSQQQIPDEALYNALVDCVGHIQQQQLQQQNQMCQQQCSLDQQQQLQQQTSNLSNSGEEEDDPIHTFLNIESYFEKELIALIQHEDLLYNHFHQNYRNVKLKMEVWQGIARKLKRNVSQCRLKWKALRDQFIREHKRLKNRENVELLPKWKHYDALGFLKEFIKQKASNYYNKTRIHQAKAENDNDYDQMNIGGSSSPLRSPLDNMKCDNSRPKRKLKLQIRDDLVTVVNNHHPMDEEQCEDSDNLCVNPGSVCGLDDMDIDEYIIGDSGSVVDNKTDLEDTELETESDQNSQQNFSVYNNPSASGVLANATALEPSNSHAFRTSVSPPEVDAQQPHQQHINLPSLDLTDHSQLMNSDSFKATSTGSLTFQTPPTLDNSDDVNLADSPEIQPAAARSVPYNNPDTLEASTNTPHPVAICSVNGVNSEDDEVGAFFKAVAMKIRNAKLPPVAFTDLQIEILKVINGSLRNN